MNSTPNQLRNNTAPPLRLALAASGYQGEAILRRCLAPDVQRFVTVAGIISDDPSNAICNPERRAWQYLDRKRLPRLVENLALASRIPIYFGDLASREFLCEFETRWRPDIVLSCFFGQRLDAEYREVASLGAYNAHACLGTVWPANPYAGANATKRMLDAGCHHCHVALHRMTDVVDGGPIVAWSKAIALHNHDTVDSVMRSTAQDLASFVVEQLELLVDDAVSQSSCKTASFEPRFANTTEVSP